MSLALQVQKHRRPVVQVLQQSLADTACPEVVAESMVALAELVRVLQAVNLGSAFEDIARSTKMFFESVSEPNSFCRWSEKCGVGRGLHAPRGWPLLAECLLWPRYPADKRVSGLQELEYLRYSAFRLYSVLASSASIKRSFFAGEVAETWVSLLLHLRDPDFAVASVSALAAYSQSHRKLRGHGRGVLPLLPAQQLPGVPADPS